MTKMTKELWDEVEKNSNFIRVESWGDPLELSVSLIMRLCAYREILDSPVVINNAYATSGHATNSLHYLGLACDSHTPHKSLYEQCKVASSLGFSVGAYPHWNQVGIHVDMRELIDKPRVFWIRDDRDEIDHSGEAVKKGDYWYFADYEYWLYGVGLYNV